MKNESAPPEIRSWDALLHPGQADDFFAGAAAHRNRPHPIRLSGEPSCRHSAWWLSEMCRLVYKRDGEPHAPDAPFSRDDYLRQAGFREHVFVDTGQLQAMVVTNQGHSADPFAVLIYRGTNNFDSWLSNLNTIQVPWREGGQVHAGFKHIFNEIWPPVSEVLSGIPLPLIIAGHSLGGALALLTASRIHPWAVYTFGAPKVGDAVFARRLNALPVYRIVNNRDLVPDLPPSRIPFDFCHTGLTCRLRPAAARRVEENGGGDDPPPPEPRFRIPDHLKIFAPPEFLADHAPISYSNRLLAGCLGETEHAAGSAARPTPQAVQPSGAIRHSTSRRR